MEPMKISFGFNKLVKKSNIIPNNLRQKEKKIELIECLEGQSIKIKDAVEVEEKPLVIPLKDNKKNLLDRIRDAKKREKNSESKQNEREDTRPDSELNSDELAARQLLKEAKDRLANGYNANTSKVSILPLSEDTPSLEGEKEPTLEDYESIPISDYGLALLRGMGWKDGMAIGRNSSKSAPVSVPELRPKGLGLGATKVVQSEMPAKKAVDKDGNELILVKGGCAKVIAGPQKGNYCEVQGFDEEAGRVVIKVFPRGEIVNINELMLVPVTKEEFSKGSKIINNAKYEEYKEISDKKLDNYRVRPESSDTRMIKEEAKYSDSEDDKKQIKKEYESGRTSKYRESPARHERSGERRKERESQDRRASNKKSSPDYSSSEDEEKHSHQERKRYSEKEPSKHTSRSANKSTYTSKKDKYSSDEDYYEKDKKSKKHTKSKNRDRSRSVSKDRHRKSKKQSSQRRETSDSDQDKKEKRKKTKCKSRHRRNSSSSSDDRRQYRSK